MVLIRALKDSSNYKNRKKCIFKKLSDFMCIGLTLDDIKNIHNLIKLFQHIFFKLIKSILIFRKQLVKISKWGFKIYKLLFLH